MTNLVEIRGLRKDYGALSAVDGVDLDVVSGETLAVVGESGSGKTTLTRLLLCLIEPTAGTVRFDGADLRALGAASLRKVRREMQVVLQDPYSSMNPRLRVTEIVGEPLVTHDPAMRGRRGRAKVRERVAGLLDAVGLSPQVQDRYPHEFSGGQRQRISIARALAPNPSVLIADEPVSALDVSVRGQILDLLASLVEQFALTLIFVSHDLGVVRHVCDRVAVMRRGEIVELGDVEQVYDAPQHEYTRELLAAAPNLRAELARLSGGDDA